MPRSTAVLAALSALLIAGSACSDRAATVLPASEPGVIVGLYVARDADGSGQHPITGGRIGVFREEFLPGTLQYSPPAPVAEARTDARGAFRITGLAPGRYFVVPLDAHGMPSGRWVRISADRGASIGVVDCSDCPPPE